MTPPCSLFSHPSFLPFQVSRCSPNSRHSRTLFSSVNSWQNAPHKTSISFRLLHLGRSFGYLNFCQRQPLRPRQVVSPHTTIDCKLSSTSRDSRQESSTRRLQGNLQSGAATEVSANTRLSTFEVRKRESSQFYGQRLD